MDETLHSKALDHVELLLDGLAAYEVEDHLEELHYLALELAEILRQLSDGQA